MRARLLSGDKLARRRVKDIGRDDARVHARARAMNLDLVHARYSLSLSLSLSIGDSEIAEDRACQNDFSNSARKHVVAASAPLWAAVYVTRSPRSAA